MRDQREAIHAYLSLGAHGAYQTFAEENGVSVTGLLEAQGLELMTELRMSRGSTDVRQDWVKRARKIDAERRRRGR
jgi:hypothetical protein